MRWTTHTLSMDKLSSYSKLFSLHLLHNVQSNYTVIYISHSATGLAEASGGAAGKGFSVPRLSKPEGMKMTAIITANPAEQFRSKAANLMVSAAQMTLHQLVDEFQRLADLIDQHSSEDEHGYTTLTEIGQLAIREQRMVNGAARARFGISFESYDRTRNNCLDF